MDMSRPTRRTVARAAAWSAPAVVAASAAPAFANSAAAPELTFAPGASAPVMVDINGLPFYDLEFAGAALHVSGAPIPAGQLSLTVSVTPVMPQEQAAVWVFAPEHPWVDNDTSGSQERSSVRYVYSSALADGAYVPLSGTWFGNAFAVPSGGQFNLLFEGPGGAQVLHTFAFAGYLPPAPEGAAAFAKSTTRSRSRGK